MSCITLPEAPFLRVCRLLVCIASLAGVVSAPLGGQTVRQQNSISPETSASTILESAANALASVKLASYNVRFIPAGSDAIHEVSDGITFATVAVGAPLRYRAGFESSAASTLAVSDGNTLRVSEDGQLNDYPVRALIEHASADVLPTHELFDPEFYRHAIATHSGFYAGKDDVDGDLCYIVAIPTIPDDGVGSKTNYLWISAKTGLPRAKQVFWIVDGKTLLTRRWVISNIQLNPDIPPDTFLYHPTLADSRSSSIAPVPTSSIVGDNKQVSETLSLKGRPIPEFAVRNMNYEAVSLPRVLPGKVTILSLWATWCPSCLAEFPAFQKLINEHPGQVQVIALAINDSRLRVITFAKAHPEYKFLFLTADDSPRGEQALGKFFVGESLPRNALFDTKGSIVEYQLSYEGKFDQLQATVNRLLAGAQ